MRRWRFMSLCSGLAFLLSGQNQMSNITQKVQVESTLGAARVPAALEVTAIAAGGGAQPCAGPGRDGLGVGMEWGRPIGGWNNNQSVRASAGPRAHRGGRGRQCASSSRSRRWLGVLHTVWH